MRFKVTVEVNKRYTEGLFEDDTGRVEKVRIETTSHDFMECFVNCIMEGSRRWKLSRLEDLIANSSAMTLSIPAICETILARRTGARIGLIVTEGFEKNAYFEGEEKNPIFSSLVAEKMVVGIKEEVTNVGDQVLAPDSDQVRDKVRHLLEFGAGVIVVSLKNASFAPINEKIIKKMIESDYPKHYLGAVSVFLSTDFGSEGDDFLRTNNCVLNAYCWSNLADFLQKIETFLREHQSRNALLVAYPDGGSTTTTGVTPIKTIGQKISQKYLRGEI